MRQVSFSGTMNLRARDSFDYITLSRSFNAKVRHQIPTQLLESSSIFSGQDACHGIEPVLERWMMLFFRNGHRKLHFYKCRVILTQISVESSIYKHLHPQDPTQNSGGFVLQNVRRERRASEINLT